MLKTEVEPRAAGEWFHCQVLTTLCSTRVYTIENCHRFVFYNYMEKVQAEFALFSIGKALVKSDVIFIVCSLIDNSGEPISARDLM